MYTDYTVCGLLDCGPAERQTAVSGSLKSRAVERVRELIAVKKLTAIKILTLLQKMYKPAVLRFNTNLLLRVRGMIVL